MTNPPDVAAGMPAAFLRGASSGNTANTPGATSLETSATLLAVQTSLGSSLVRAFTAAA